MKLSRRYLRDRLGNKIAAPTTTDMCYDPLTGKSQKQINQELKERVDYLSSLINKAQVDPENVVVRPFNVQKTLNGWKVVSPMQISTPSVEIVADKYVRIFYGMKYEVSPTVTLGLDKTSAYYYKVYINNPQNRYVDIGFIDSYGRDMLISNISEQFTIQMLVTGR